MTLYIDTTSQNETVVSLRKHGAEVSSMRQDTVRSGHAQILLVLIDRLLSQQGIKVTDVTAVQVHCGPGSFTGTRVGVAVANCLAFALGIPVNGLPIGTSAAPLYAGPPHITLPTAKN